jgi:hypothetical protein
MIIREGIERDSGLVPSIKSPFWDSVDIKEV